MHVADVAELGSAESYSFGAEDAALRTPLTLLAITPARIASFTTSFQVRPESFWMLRRSAATSSSKVRVVLTHQSITALMC